jgi:hypothetical protein
MKEPKIKKLTREYSDTAKTDRNDVMPCKVQSQSNQTPITPKTVLSAPTFHHCHNVSDCSSPRSLIQFNHHTSPLPDVPMTRPPEYCLYLRHESTLPKLLCWNPRAFVGFLVTRQLIASLETIFATILAAGDIAGKVIGF